MTPTLDTYFAAFRDAARFHRPASTLKCERINAFRVFQQSMAAEMSTPTLGATICDKGKPYFFSRAWEEKQFNPNAIAFDFPLLFIFETEATAKMTAVEDGVVIVSHRLQVGVVDVYAEPKATSTYCAGCEGRTVNEIYRSTEQLLYYALKFVANVGTSVRLDGLKYITHRSACDACDDFEPLHLLNDTTLEPVVRIERPAERIYGTATFIRATAKHCLTSDDVAFDVKDFGTLSHEAGCSTCQ